ncbi:MAG: CoA transferase [Candidatus Binatia bacterium]
MEKSDFYRDAYKDFPGPLTGVRVVEATTTWAGPMCGCILADFGADVVKIELPGGEVTRRIPPFLPGTKGPVSFIHATVNRNKRSVTLDLRQPEGREAFLRLAENADIVVENFRPGTMQKWGVGYRDVERRNRDIVYVSMSAFGQFGPDSGYVGYDPLAQAASGFMSLNGSADGQAVKAPTFLGDDLGGVHAALGALAALRHRDQTGEGQHVDVALLDAILFQSNGYLTLGALDIPLKRFGNEYASVVPANAFACRDGQVYLGTLLDTHWRALARLMGREDLADHPDYATGAARSERRREINALVSAWAAAQTVEELLAKCHADQVPAAPIRDYGAASRDPHVRARDMLQSVPQEGDATAPITGPAVKFSRSPVRIRSGAPPLGAHTDEVLREVGYDPSEIRALRAKGVI